MDTGGENEVITRAVSGPGDWWEWELWDETSNHQEENGNQMSEKEGISGNRIKLVTAVKLRPQHFEKTCWLEKKGEHTEFVLLLTFIRGW